MYDGLKMAYGHVIQGPAIVEQPTTTIIVPPGYSLGLDEFNNYVIFHPELSPEDITKTFRKDPP